MRLPGDVLLIACYELGHQPLAVAWPAAFLERAGYAPAVMDLSVEPFDPEKVTRARFIAISVPMHTALRLGVIAARRIRAINPTAHICFYGLYAALNATELLADACADSVLAGELEDRLVDLVRRLEAGELVEAGEARRANASLSERASPPRPRSPAGSSPRRAREAELPRASTPRAPWDQEVRARRAGGAPRSRGVRRGQPRLQASLPPLPDPAGLRRPVLRRPGRDGAGRRAPAGRGRRQPRDVRRPGFPQRSAPRPGRGARAARRVSIRDVRLHRQGRAPAARAPAPAGAGRARLRVHRHGRGVARRSRARPSRQGPHAQRSRGRAGRCPGGGDRAPAHVGRLHAVDDARWLPRVARLPGRRGAGGPRGSRAVRDPAADPARLAAARTCPRCASISRDSCGAASTTGGSIRIPGSSGWPRRSRVS